MKNSFDFIIAEQLYRYPHYKAQLYRLSRGKSKIFLQGGEMPSTVYYKTIKTFLKY